MKRFLICAWRALVVRLRYWHDPSCSYALCLSVELECYETLEASGGSAP